MSRRSQKRSLPRSLTYISLFSGIGGFEEGIIAVFPNAKCLGYSEISDAALRVYREHFPDHPALGDITNIDGNLFRGKVDLLVGGSPCQNFSMIGDHKGIKGVKSKLINEYLRLLKEIQPKFFVLENVKMSKKNQDLISDLIGCEPVCIDSNIVSHQRRKRLYWCNFDVSSLANKPALKGSVNKSLLPKNDKRLREVLEKDLDKPKSILDKKLKNICKGSNDHYIIGMNRTDLNSPTLTTEASGHHFVCESSNKARQLHPIEMENLQTFPQDWTSSLTRTQRSMVLGNAVTCKVIEKIMKILKSEMNKKHEKISEISENEVKSCRTKSHESCADSRRKRLAKKHKSARKSRQRSRK